MQQNRHKKKGEREIKREKRLKMAVMEKLKMFVVNEPIVAASCLIGGVGTFIFINPSFCYFLHHF
ncbi:hypothetical protein HanRHA438_Chr16g0773821 [Helianthus annuus]|nr:hypothetical protein HanRHA438_Chr16g0773821 [Helianthus annuus]